MTQSPTTGGKQDQFLDVIDRDEAERRFQSALELRPLGEEAVLLGQALGRVLAQDIAAPVDVPFFDRSRSGWLRRPRGRHLRGAGRTPARSLRLNPEAVATGMVPQTEVLPGTATVIATGGMVPRGADAVVMVEHTHVAGDTVQVLRPVAPGTAITFRRIGHRTWGNRAPTGGVAGLSRDGRPRRARSRPCPRLPSPAGRHPVHRGRAHRARGPNAAGARVRFQRDDLGRRSKGAGRGSRGSGDRA